MSTTCTMTRDEILAKVRPLVVDSLAVEAEDVQYQSRLVTDLGADSLDFIDLIFMLEGEFDIKIRGDELDFMARLDFSSPEVMQDGHLTQATIEQLRQWLPAIEDLEDPEKITPTQLFSLITAETLCILVERKLADFEAA